MFGEELPCGLERIERELILDKGKLQRPVPVEQRQHTASRSSDPRR